MAHGPEGLLAGIPTTIGAMLGGSYLRGMPFGKTLHQVSSMIPDITGNALYEPGMQAIRSGLFGPEETKQEALKRRLYE